MAGEGRSTSGLRSLERGVRECGSMVNMGKRSFALAAKHSLCIRWLLEDECYRSMPLSGRRRRGTEASAGRREDSGAWTCLMRSKITMHLGTWRESSPHPTPSRKATTGSNASECTLKALYRLFMYMPLGKTFIHRHISALNPDPLSLRCKGR